MTRLLEHFTQHFQRRRIVLGNLRVLLGDGNAGIEVRTKDCLLNHVRHLRNTLVIRSLDLNIDFLVLNTEEFFHELLEIRAFDLALSQLLQFRLEVSQLLFLGFDLLVAKACIPQILGVLLHVL